MTFRIFIYCDDPSHARRAAVTNFEAIDTGMFRGWREVPASRANRKTAGTGQTIVRDTLPEPGWALDPEVSDSDTRSRFEMVCRRCLHPRPVVARQECLFPVLDGLRAFGVSEVALAVAAASLQEQSERRKPLD